MKQSARNFAAFGGITVIMYSMYLTFFGALFPYDVTPASPVPVNPMLLCGIAGLTAAGLSLAASFMPPIKITMSRIFVCVAAALTITIAAVMITALFDLLLSLIFGIPALILTVAAIKSFIPDKNQSGTNRQR
jgi:hypothetical protein